MGSYARQSTSIQGSIAATGVPSNMALSGDGFFVVATNEGNANSPSFSDTPQYTRRGDFTQDANGYLVNGAGEYLCGTASGTSATVPIKIPASSGSAALSNISIAKGSWEAKVVDAVAPAEDELVIPKTSSSLFNSTNIDYLLRNIGIEELVVTGFLTDQCIDHTVKDAADRGYYPTLIRDACMANTRERHEAALTCFAGYCRMLTTAQFVGMLAGTRRYASA